MTDHPKLLLREESGKDTASFWVLIKLNQIYLASLLAVLVQLPFVQMKSRCSSAPAEPPLCSSASGTWRTHTAGQGDSVGLSSVPSLTVSPVTDNCVLTQVEFLHSLHRKGSGLHKPCASPCVGLSGAELCHCHRELILWAFPHLKLESQPFHCSLMFSWTCDISIDLQSLLLLPVHYCCCTGLAFMTSTFGELQQPATIFNSRFTWFMFLSYTCIFCRLSSQNQHIYHEVVIALKSCTWWDHLYRFLSLYTTQQF